MQTRRLAVAVVPLLLLLCVKIFVAHARREGMTPAIMFAWVCWLVTLGNYVCVCVRKGRCKTRSAFVSQGSAQPLVCSKCALILEPGSAHCLQCQFCVVGRDHHCIFTNSCIGSTNARHHLRFLFYFTLLLGFVTMLLFDDFDTLDNGRNGTSMLAAYIIVPLLQPLMTASPALEMTEHWMLHIAIRAILGGAMISGVLLVLQLILTTRGQTLHEWLHDHPGIGGDIRANMAMVSGRHGLFTWWLPWWPFTEDHSYLRRHHTMKRV